MGKSARAVFMVGLSLVSISLVRPATAGSWDGPYINGYITETIDQSETYDMETTPPGQYGGSFQFDTTVGPESSGEVFGVASFTWNWVPDYPGDVPTHQPLVHISGSGYAGWSGPEGQGEVVLAGFDTNTPTFTSTSYQVDGDKSFLILPVTNADGTITAKTGPYSFDSKVYTCDCGGGFIIGSLQGALEY